MEAKKEIQRGEAAEQLLRNELLQEAFAMVESGIIEQWKAAPIRDREGQHELKLMLKLLGDVRGYIKEVANTGKLARIGADKSANVAIMSQKYY